MDSSKAAWNDDIESNVDDWYDAIPGIAHEMDNDELRVRYLDVSMSTGDMEDMENFDVEEAHKIVDAGHRMDVLIAQDKH